MINIPRSVQYNTGDERGYRSKDQFFADIINGYNLSSYAPHEARIEISYLFPQGDSRRLDGQISANQIHILKFRQAVIASVFETRTQSNYVQFDFFFNEKTLEKKFEEVS